VVKREKATTVEKAGLLEVINTTESLDTVGGNENLKEWIKRSMLLVGEEARAFHARPPKGVLLVGVPGCGKSLAAAAIATDSNRPLLRFDVGKVFDKYQGESEAKIRRCLAIAEAVAPCVLWIDELEKSFSGTSGSDSDGHGTTKRVFSTFLTWMQEKKADVFLVATANNVDSLPPELYRPGRIDASFWLGLPDEPQREEIIKIHLKKLERPDLFNAEQMKQLAQASDKFSGAALQTWVQAAVNYAFINGKDEVGIQDFLDTVGEVAITDEKEKNITRAMEWARKNRARMASKSAEKKVGPEVTGERKLNLKLAGGLKVKDVPKAGDNAPQA
jgi:SpoVK/Ycf46/Vps4 family AAA+-type ATPase